MVLGIFESTLSNGNFSEGKKILKELKCKYSKKSPLKCFTSASSTAVIIFSTSALESVVLNKKDYFEVRFWGFL